MARRKCPVCGLYVGAKPHTGALHERIRTNQRLAALGKLGRSGRLSGLRRRIRRR